MVNHKNFNNITIVIYSLGGGGAERVAAELATGFDNRGKKVTIITLSDTIQDFYLLPTSVNRIKLTNRDSVKRGKIQTSINFIKKLRNSILEGNPDVVISFMPQTNMKVQLSLLGCKVPVIVTEHSDPKRLKSSPFWYCLRFLIYPFSNKVISVSGGINSYFYWIRNKKKSIIYNPLTDIQINADTDATSIDSVFNYPNTIISMGRLEYNKGFDILIRSFIKIAKKYPNWQLIILGDGNERSKLEEIIEKANMESRILLPGRFSNPFIFMKKSDIFALTSRNEGFGNVLIEAMACNLPVIAIKSMGPVEIINHNVNGILCENQEEFLIALEELMNNSNTRVRLSDSASNDIVKYDLNKILDQWERTIASVL